MSLLFKQRKKTIKKYCTENKNKGLKAKIKVSKSTPSALFTGAHEVYRTAVSHFGNSDCVDFMSTALSCLVTGVLLLRFCIESSEFVCAFIVVTYG